MRLRTGTDIIEIQRVRDSIQRQGRSFLDRIFTPAEQRYCQAHTADPATRYAGRFAAKEAVSKALGTGIGGDLGWQDLEIRSGDRGEPSVHLSEEAQQRWGGEPQLTLSISHCKEYATAFAILICEEEI